MRLLLNSPRCAGRSESHGRRGDYKSFPKLKRRKESRQNDTRLLMLKEGDVGRQVG